MSNPGPSSSKALKRPREADDATSSKKSKVHPFFNQKRSDVTESAEETPFQWLQPLGPKKTCLHGLNLKPVSSAKVAALDLDGTVIKSELRHGSDWAWWAPAVPKRLKELHEDGYSIVLISNQNLKSAQLATWKEKVAKIAKALESIPFRILAATMKDEFRKPMPGMWCALEKIFEQDGVTIDKEQSYYVGDAAGRVYSKTKKDFASTDRKWALNLDLKFFTPEEYFLGLNPNTTFELPGFNVSTLPQRMSLPLPSSFNLPIPLTTSSSVPEILPTSLPLLPLATTQELVLFVGFPSLGKTSFYQKHFKSAGYVHINQDTLKTRQKCVKAVEEAVKEGRSCVVDNTNRDKATRKFYVDLARKEGISVRCFHFAGSVELAWHNNLYRAFAQPLAETEVRRELIPYTAYITFKDGFEEPNANEGFAEVRRVNFVFDGTEEQRKRWGMWLQITGK
ncbi:PNK3P-domain-containing protein [Coprinellus micaceus]|uniref:PNK3P-domain-containing protein n=1 Tax=Coprinellus micaceus TaxID=71717 RepID=A0A4Y7TPD4_COPMI|nr:PNK3P-domain-containing protein [Coprinellus micaceus]